MKILDLNVNGYQAFLGKGGRDFVLNENPDIVCFQEIRTKEPESFGLGYFQYHNRADRKGYAGSMVLSKIEPLANLTEKYDWGDEGRLQVLEFEDFILVNVYVPNHRRNSARYSYRIEFNQKYIKILQELMYIKPIIICSDFNAVRSELDMDIHAKDYEINEFLNNEREILINQEELGFYDPIRKLYRSKKIFSPGIVPRIKIIEVAKAEDSIAAI